MTRAAWILVVGALIGGSTYLLLIDTTSLPELYVLAGTAAACATAFFLAREQGFAEGRLRPWWVGRAWRVLLHIPADIALLTLQALDQLIRPRAQRGTFRAVRFEAVEDNPEQAGRRSLTEWLGSAAPNTLVVGVDRDRRLVLVHQLQKQGDADSVDPLGLG